MTTAARGAIARIPGSKSITNRALLLAAAALGPSRLGAPLVSADTVAFRRALEALGVRVDEQDGDWVVHGTGRGPHGRARIWCEDAGTAARFLPVLAAAGFGRFEVDGTEQLRARPLGPLVDALVRLGAEVTVGPGGRLPLVVRTTGLQGGEIALDSTSSSQYLTGLLLSAPLMRSPLTVHAAGLVSRPYIDMTVALMRRFGAGVAAGPDGRLRVTGNYRATDLRIEPDASTASYVFAAAAVTGRSVTVPGLGRDSLQGDLRFVEVLRRAGAEVEIGEDGTTVTGTGQLRGGFEVDMGDISDTFMTLAAIAPLADGPITVTGIRHARFKESDRIAAVAGNLGRLGIEVTEGPDRLTVHPGPVSGGPVDCHRDHRIAMSFSVLGLRVPGIVLDDPACVDKTFPEFHTEFARLFA
ncbi:3-phosphoshikimate 1-carboxyvinyltransferase [Kitasatospora sp. DSM 101779]|uniref:3-phosphoshikimate 1-carboxyvinyltransferase n=1 Tax=Kitasatospora sp. DSM 101779 TaxID=2853165 RepID=UPI0021D8A294|nr:3-phosphoshikimate 1-carboxyvinyltransferase [Kitasatospora sp. DSM 101779]MCU7823761.1 3-phosphoshikimate 1-carboxyvinyltransferase [Kitasatospora sp. DSM 101779]